MKFFIDFEATQPENEIISIGVVAENGATFHTYVKPQFSKLTQYITNLTGIEEEDLESAPNIETAFILMYHWIRRQSPRVCTIDDEFYCYGSSDKIFVENTLLYLHEYNARTLGAILYAYMKDASVIVGKYFNGNPSLINAFNYLKEQEGKQRHDALEDAKMLQYVFTAVKDAAPLDCNPFKEVANNIPNSEGLGVAKVDYVFPHGKFYCRAKKTQAWTEFEDIHEAIDWLIKTTVIKSQWDKVHRDRMAVSIMKAIKNNSQYNGKYWKRVK